LTIKPYCTNALFNTCTEIVKDEGDDSCQVAVDNSTLPNFNSNDVYGLKQEVKRAYMVSNTEYSSPDIGFTYYPGYDIFDNHTLRNLSFRPIMTPTTQIDETRQFFNATTDFMRTKDGKRIKLYPRFSYGDVKNNGNMDMHIYEHSNLLPFIDGSSAAGNLMVENGWFGFKNASSISENNGDEKSGVQRGSILDKSHIFCHTINNAGNCEFVDMFPDRTRYSFIPHYNSFRNRYEKNWDVFLTYAWKNYYNHNLVMNVKVLGDELTTADNTKGLIVFRLLRTRLSNNRKAILFRTFCKHNVSVNDKIVAYVSKDGGKHFTRLAREYAVDYVGDVDGNNKDYFFAISSKAFLNDLFSGSIQEPNRFYKPYTETPPEHTVDVSWEISDVPEGYSDDVVRVFRYVDDYEAASYSSNATFDVMPKTVNNYTPEKIRVWDGSYTFYVWNVDTSVYESCYENPRVSYGSWNTFTDVPDVQASQYIRVKSYRFYKKGGLQLYQTVSELDTDAVVNSFLTIGGWQVRFARVANDNVLCKYYIRQFRKVPNFKNSTEEVPEGLSENTDKFLTFVTEKASDNDGNMLEYDSETYRLAFSKTLYGDDVAQVTFLDTMDIRNLTDNLGRPITEIYATVVKRNKGYKEWYIHNTEPIDRTVVGSDEIEYSRCFGSVTTGLEYLNLDDEFDRDNDVWNLKGKMSSVNSLYKCTSGDNCPNSLEDWDNGNQNGEITESDDVFFGDVVEFDPVKCRETVLSDACFRFNTAQRELGEGGEDGDFNFTYHELEYDDYDPSDMNDEYGERKVPFRVCEYRQWDYLDTNTNEPVDTGTSYLRVAQGKNVSINRKEGYFYKPHTRIPLLRFSDKVYQGSHRTMRIKECQPLQADAIYIKVKTLSAHGLGGGTVLYVVNGDDWYESSIVYVIDSYSFAMKPITKDDVERNGLPYLDWVAVCDGINSGTMKLRVKSETIPSYASRVDENVFLWRDIV
ncbi:MAG: hypothetical protein J6X18_13725, partial [Bacteroidales bacterium]|nr:hypothetical protein [Bacteroidales bacterium]